MDRLLIYPFEQPQETDLLNAQKFAMLGLAQLAGAALGSGPLLQGLACTPGTGLTVSVAAGQIYQSEVVDATAFSSLAADSRTALKQGVVWTPTVLNCPAPGTAGQSINYLVEVGFVEADIDPVILPFYDASNPTVPYNGPNGSGVPSNTVRSDECVVQVKAGTAATTGTQTTPAVDAGFIGAYVVTVAYGAASITSGNITVAAGAPFISAGIGQTFQVCAGNPNGQLAGTAAAASTAFPTMAYDIAHGALWVCTTTGTASTAVWAEVGGGSGAWPYWCGTSTGTANAQTITTPAAMLSLATGTSVALEIGAGLTNTGATTLTVGSFGTFPLRKDGPTGPVALAGGELVAGNLVSARFDGTYLHLTATEMGTAALANASSNTGTVAAVSGAVAVGNVPAFSDVLGTLMDSGVKSKLGAVVYFSGALTITAANYAENFVSTATGTLTVPQTTATWAGFSFSVSANVGTVTVVPNAADKINEGTPGASYLVPNGTSALFVGDGAGNIEVFYQTAIPGSSPAPQYISTSQSIVGGQYAVDTSAAPLSLTLPASPAMGTSIVLMDAEDTWAVNNVTLVAGGTNTINGSLSAFSLDVLGAQVLLVYKSGNWGIE